VSTRSMHVVLLLQVDTMIEHKTWVWSSRLWFPILNFPYSFKISISN